MEQARSYLPGLFHVKKQDKIKRIVKYLFKLTNNLNFAKVIW